MIEQIILGLIQGVAEWLPVSSEGLIVLAKIHLFPDSSGIDTKIQMALFLHLGTLLAAAIYFWQDVVLLIKTLLQYTTINSESKRLLNFLITATLISGVIGFLLLSVLLSFAEQFSSSWKLVNLLIGLSLLGTAYLELRAKHSGYKGTNDLKLIDGILLGIAQGFAAIPGLSRSGLTVSALLLRKFDKTLALKISFLMSIPIIFFGNVAMCLFGGHETQFSIELLAGFISSFIFGLITIHLLLKIAQKINFGYFVLCFGLLTIGAIFI